MKIAVTGANGYLGQGVVKELLDRGVKVVAADKKLDRVDRRAEKIEGNIFELQDPFSKFGEPDVLLHLAWRNGFVHDAPSHIEDLPSHFNFLTKMLTSGLHQIAVMGSMHEIGFYEGSVDENTDCNPLSLYGVGKDALRKAMLIEAKKAGATIQWLRGFYIVGNSRYGSSIFSKIFEANEAGKKEFPFTMGQNQYDFIDYPDFCSQVAATVMQTKIDGIINIGSGKPEKLADRVERFISENHFDIKLVFGAFPDRPYDSKAIWGNHKKIQHIMDEAKIK